MVLVEGGPTAIKKYKRLLLRRIDWNQKTKPRSDEEKKEKSNEEEEDID